MTVNGRELASTPSHFLFLFSESTAGLWLLGYDGLSVFVKERRQAPRVSASVEQVVYAGFGVYPDFYNVDRALRENLFKMFHSDFSSLSFVLRVIRFFPDAAIPLRSSRTIKNFFTSPPLLMKNIHTGTCEPDSLYFGCICFAILTKRGRVRIIKTEGHCCMAVSSTRLTYVSPRARS